MLPLCFAALLWFAPVTAADRIEFHDGTVLEGRVLALSADAVRIRTGDVEFLVPMPLVRVVAASTAPGPVPSLASPPDRVTLSDGSLVIGRIVAETRDSVTVRRADHDRLIPRRSVALVERGLPGPLTAAMEELAREALRRLAGEDPAVRESARATLLALGPPVEPVLRAALTDAALAPEALAALREILGEPSPAVPSLPIPAGALRVLRDTTRGESLLTERLGLTDDQRARVHELLGEAAHRLAEARALFTGGKRAESAAAIRSLVDTFRQEMGEVLTDVQRRAFEELLAGAE